MSEATATFKKTPGAQQPLFAEAVINFNDTVAPIAGGADVPLNGVAVNVQFATFDLPYGASVVGGDAVVETAFATSTAATLVVGDALSANRYLASTDIKTAARTPLIVTGFKTASAVPVLVTVATTVAAATAGKVRVRVMYVIEGRVNENL